MTPVKIKISFCVVLAAVASSLVLVAGAGARVMPEPGGKSPVTQPHIRKPAVKKATRRSLGGYPSQSGQHVKSQAELRTE